MNADLAQGLCSVNDVVGADRSVGPKAAAMSHMEHLRSPRKIFSTDAGFEASLPLCNTPADLLSAVYSNRNNSHSSVICRAGPCVSFLKDSHIWQGRFRSNFFFIAFFFAYPLLC